MRPRPLKFLATRWRAAAFTACLAALLPELATGAPAVIGLAPDQVCAGVAYIDATGSPQTGTRTCDDAVACSTDGQIGCVASSPYPAVDTSALAPSQITLGKTVAGVVGALAPCAMDGQQDCLTTTDFKAVATTGLTASQVLSGKTLAGVTGNGALATSCTASVTTGCATTAAFPAADFSTLTAADIRLGVSIGSLTGLLKIPRSGANLALYDQPATPVDIGPYDNFTIDPSTGILTLSTASFWDNGVAVTVSSDNSLPTGLSAATTYYSIIVSPTEIKLATSAANATLGVSVSVSDAGTGNLQINVTGDAVTEYWDSIDDGNFGVSGLTTAALPDAPFGANYLAGASDWTMVGPCAAPSDDCVAHDNLSNLTWTMVAPHGVAAMTWAEAVAFCTDLSFGGYASGWRLPTVKEAMLGYIDNLAQLVATYPNFGYGGPVWTATQPSEVSARGHAFGTFMSNGFWGLWAKTNGFAVTCVRDGL